MVALHVVGNPGRLGGACTQLWATLRLWRDNGVEVDVVPTWNMDREWRTRCEQIGCTVHNGVSPDTLLDVPGIRKGVVLGMCNKNFLAQAGQLRKAGAKLIWVSCMCFIFRGKDKQGRRYDEDKFYAKHGPFDAHMFQSHWQRSQLWPTLKRYGLTKDRCYRIPGAFVRDEYPFEPREHRPGREFVIGRHARSDLDKHSSNTWKIYGKVAYRPIRARLMGWSQKAEEKLGKPPTWAEALPCKAEDTQDFLRSLHCLVPVNGGAQENWPRAGLEAMSMGVPIVAQKKWGWRDMIRHGETGYLCDSHEDFSYYVAKLAREEETRQTMMRRARKVLVEEYANPQVLWNKWQRLFEGVLR